MVSLGFAFAFAQARIGGGVKSLMAFMAEVDNPFLLTTVTIFESTGGDMTSSVSVSVPASAAGSLMSNEMN